MRHVRDIGCLQRLRCLLGHHRCMPPAFLGRVDRSRRCRPGGYRFTRRSSGLATRLADFYMDEVSPYRHDLPGLAAQGHDPARHGRWNLHVRLVGHDVGQGLVFDDLVARRHMPGDQFDLCNAFAQVGHLDDMYAHTACTTRIMAWATRAGPGEYAHSWAWG